MIAACTGSASVKASGCGQLAAAIVSAAPVWVICAKLARHGRILIMLLEFDISHCTRVCAATGRTFAPGETYFSTLHADRGATVRKDYCADQWRGPDDNAIAWWKSRVDRDARPKLAPQDVLLNLFADLANRPDEAEFRYVLGLLLVRRRLLKLDETRRWHRSLPDSMLSFRIRKLGNSRNISPYSWASRPRRLWSLRLA